MNTQEAATADTLRDAAYRVGRAVRVAADVVAAQAGRKHLPSDVQAWQDLRDASGRLSALVAQYDPGDIEPPPPGPSGGAPPAAISRKRVIV
ncbi:hypothetical protein GCE86_06670 [Micromonospora terminaliae]|uniref:Uncharacterized protein n=1 Tax=Micromonospora terminaliae TaxID=1914461 RepID=A0AAJ2ZJA6_9ACTN|nr:hypothetical protein [Micromonospora terminaliae]NES30068.1 hypothetical protein [Micromonospora terminaliae]QGL46759.1 hypothetical protein GCE86_06670 [Micromonospora terminaliae]